VASEKAEALIAELKEANTLATAAIGEIVADARRKIVVTK